MIGKTISHYRITRELGAGGMGVVYEAVDTKLDRTVALKFLPPESTRDSGAKARFVHEAKAAAALAHPNICTIHEIDEFEGQSFIVMECCEGETLKERIAKGPLKPEEAIDIAQQIAQGLAKAHEQGIVHRDIKPANIFIIFDGLVKILDFGLAKLSTQTMLTKTGTTLGTASYMSPEQARGEEVDHRSDIFSLGVILYEMLVGELPFKGEHMAALLYGIVHGEPEPLPEDVTTANPVLQEITDRVLAKDTACRYQQAEEIRSDLLRLLSDAGQVSTAPGSAVRAAGSSSRKRGLTYFGLAAVAAVVLFSVYFLLPRDQAQADRKSIAVLPFKNIVTEPGYEWFSDGMTEAIVGHLTKIKDLKVTSRSSTLQFRDSTLPIGEIAEQLRVATILEGSVQQKAGRIHLMVKLIDAGTDDHLWAETYDREFTDVFALQTEIALQVVRKLEATLTSEVTGRIESLPTRELEAYKLVREGVDLWGGSYKDRNLGMRRFEQAVEIDPNYAEAYGYLANFSWLITVYGNRLPKEMFPKAKAYALKALELDETNTNAHTTLGFIKSWWDRDWSAAEQHWQSLLEFAPGAAISYSGYAWHMLQTGRFNEAITLHRKAVELDPLSPGFHQNMGEILYYARRYDEAISASKQTVSMFPSYPQTRTILGLAYLGKGMKEEALKALHADLDLSQGLKPEIDNLIGHGLALAGDEVNARKVLNRLLERYEQGWASLVSIAQIYFALGETESGFAYLQKADIEHDPRLSMLKISPTFDCVREDPRFLELVQKVGLAQ